MNLIAEPVITDNEQSYESLPAEFSLNRTGVEGSLFRFQARRARDNLPRSLRQYDVTALVRVCSCPNEQSPVSIENIEIVDAKWALSGVQHIQRVMGV